MKELRETICRAWFIHALKFVKVKYLIIPFFTVHNIDFIEVIVQLILYSYTETLRRKRRAKDKHVASLHSRSIFDSNHWWPDWRLSLQTIIMNGNMFEMNAFLSKICYYSCCIYCNSGKYEMIMQFFRLWRISYKPLLVQRIHLKWWSY